MVKMNSFSEANENVATVTVLDKLNMSEKVIFIGIYNTYLGGEILGLK